jgi:hypothetical protein
MLSNEKAPELSKLWGSSLAIGGANQQTTKFLHPERVTVCIAAICYVFRKGTRLPERKSPKAL